MNVEQEIAALKTRIAQLEQKNTAAGSIPYNERQNILETIVDSEDTATAVSDEYTFPAGGGDVDLPRLPTAYLMLRWKGRLYRIPHYGDL